VGAADNFQTLSRDYYSNEAYAKALQLWNQNHPRASDAMARDGTLTPGEKVFIPPASQLEQHYGSLIPNLKPTIRPTSAVQTAPLGSTSPIPEFAYYKVIQEESVEVIARQTLGSSERVNDLLRLNPNLRSGQNVAPGTRLLLPAGALVPTENVPR
jgi:hypothetical protein